MEMTGTRNAASGKAEALITLPPRRTCTNETRPRPQRKLNSTPSRMAAKYCWVSSIPFALADCLLIFAFELLGGVREDKGETPNTSDWYHDLQLIISRA